MNINKLNDYVAEYNKYVKENNKSKYIQSFISICEHVMYLKSNNYNILPSLLSELKYSIIKYRYDMDKWLEYYITFFGYDNDLKQEYLLDNIEIINDDKIVEVNEFNL
jgi:hypothetical protein